jgi:hypothetical protein
MNSSELKRVEYKVPPAESYDGGGVCFGVTRALRQWQCLSHGRVRSQLRRPAARSMGWGALPGLLLR